MSISGAVSGRRHQQHEPALVVALGASYTSDRFSHFYAARGCGQWARSFYATLGADQYAVFTHTTMRRRILITDNQEACLFGLLPVAALIAVVSDSAFRPPSVQHGCGLICSSTKNQRLEKMTAGTVPPYAHCRARRHAPYTVNSHTRCWASEI